MHKLTFFRLAVTALAASFASGSTLYVNGVDTTRGLGSANGTSLNMSVDSGATFFDVYFAGAINTTLDGVSPLSLYCVDLFTNIYLGSTNSTTLTTPSTQPLQRVAWLLNQEFPDATTTLTGAALQIAMW